MKSIGEWKHTRPPKWCGSCTCTYQLVAELDGRVLVAGLPPLGAAAVDADPPEAGPALRPAAARLGRHLHARRRGCEARGDRSRHGRDGNRRGWGHGDGTGRQ